MDNYFPEDKAKIPQLGNILMVEGEISEGGFLTKEIDVQRDFFMTPDEGYCPNYIHKIKVLSGEIYFGEKVKNKFDKIRIVTRFDNVRPVHAKFIADIYGKRKLRDSIREMSTSQLDQSVFDGDQQEPEQDVKTVADLSPFELTEILQGMFKAKKLNISILFNELNNKVELFLPGGVEIFLLHHLLWEHLGFPSDRMLNMSEKNHGDTFVISSRTSARGFRNSEMKLMKVIGDPVDPHMKLKDVPGLSSQYMDSSDVNVYLYEFSIYIRFIDSLNSMNPVDEDLRAEKDMFAEDLSIVLSKYVNVSSPFLDSRETKITVSNKDGILYLGVDNNYHTQRKIIHFFFGNTIRRLLHLPSGTQFALHERMERLNTLSIDGINDKYFPLHVMLDNSLCVEQTSTGANSNYPSHTNLLGVFISPKKFIPAQKSFLIPSTLFNTLVLRIATKEEGNNLSYKMYARFYFQTTNVTLRKRNVLPSLY